MLRMKTQINESSNDNDSLNEWRGAKGWSYLDTFHNVSIYMHIP